MATVMETIEAHNRESDRKSSERETPSDTQTRPELPKHEQIAVLAYQFWHERGCPDGSPEIDWFRAERHLQSVNEHRSNTLALVSVPVLDLPH
jgi:hypothetical protein